MSATNVFLTPDAACLYSDAASLDETGALRLISSKVKTLPQLGAVVASRCENHRISRLLHDALDGPYQSLEEMLCDLPSLMREIVEREAQKPVAEYGHQLVVAAWSALKARAECYCISAPGCGLDTGSAPWTVYQRTSIIYPANQSVWDAVGASGSFDAKTGQLDPMATCGLTGTPLWRSVMELQRSGRWGKHPGLAVIGGFFTETKVSAAGIAQRVVHSWNDRIGSPMV